MKRVHRTLAPRSSRADHARASARGMAIVIVLVVLLVLLVLATPFLLMARNADAASNELADRADVRIALDTAGRHLRAVLQESHATADKTPYWDARDEVDVSNEFDPKFLVASDPRGAMWDAAVEDVASKIDLNSCSPHVIANLMGLSKRFSEAVADDAKTLKLSSAMGLRPEGLVWATGELVQYTKIDESALVKFTRGVLGPQKGQDWRGGPRPASVHDLGEPVLDQRALAPCLWRTVGEHGTLRAYAALEELTLCAEFDIAAVLAKPEGGSPVFDAAAFDPLFRATSVHAGIGAGAVWQHPTRVTTTVEARKDGKVRVESVRWINSGATVQITDGTNTEIALVQSVSRGGEVFFDKLLANDFVAYRAELRVLARRPVNLNTASPEVLTALFSNLQVAGRNSRILREEAQRIGSIVIQSRPLEGFEDFLRRVVLPCAGLEKLPSDAPVVPEELVAGAGFLTADKALALYSNGLNANDGALAFATMPYCFTTRDVYEFELRAGVNALSGVERASRVRDEVAVIAPQRELLKVWGRQEDFDEAGRLDQAAPWWMSGPHATTRYDVRPNPPASPPSSFVWAHMGTAGGQTYLPGVTDTSAFKDAEAPTPEHVFPSREQTAWVQLWPYRTDETGQRQKRVLHFDHETRDLEGRYLPDEPILRPSDDPLVHWTDKQSTSGRAPLARPFALDLWVKPRSLGPGRLLDFGGTSNETDRVSLLLENEDLVLRVLDGTGDHPDTEFKEAGEVRFKIAAGPGPGLPVDVWSHVSLQVNGNRPSQVDVRVNGFAHGVRRLGMTRLTSAAPQGASTLNVESTEGFPERGVVRVGNELIEVTKAGNSLSATRTELGQYAGFGGRIAREQLGIDNGTGTDGFQPAADLDLLDVDHAAGATVELYGYSAPLATNVATGASALTSVLGPWRVARAIGVVGGETPEGNPMRPQGWTFIDVGWGLDGTGGNPSSNEPTALVLASADDPNNAPETYMPAFDPNGGYAAIVQAWFPDTITQRGARVGGVEIIRYSGVDGVNLKIEQRGIDAAELSRIQQPESVQGMGPVATESRAFIIRWNPIVPVNVGTTVEDPEWFLKYAVFVVPISISVRDASEIDYDQHATLSRFAQLTHVTDAENTEWVRYDQFKRGQLVRDEWEALNRLWNVLVNYGDVAADPPGVPPTQPTPPGGGGGGTGGGGAGGMAVLSDEPAPPAELASASKVVPAAAPASAQYGSNWEPRIGKSEIDPNAFPLSDAALAQFQFRGVLGTFTHEHPVGTLVLPVFAVHAGPYANGRPGRLDAAFLVGADSDHPGWPVTVHRAQQPGVTLRYPRWSETADAQTIGPELQIARFDSTTGDFPYDDFIDTNLIYVALQQKAPEPMSPAVAASTGSTLVDADPREFARLVCFPSGELPRQTGRVAVGGTRDGSNAEVPSVLVDEIVFGDARVSNLAINGALPFTGASFVIDPQYANNGISDEALSFRVFPKTLRTANGDRFEDHKFLGDLPEDAGLLRIGEEIVCYDKRDPETGEFQLCNSGRGLLGTRAQPHEASEPVLFLEYATVTFLAGGIGATDASLPVANTEEFPEQGTVLIGEELIHYTRLRSGVLEMPRASSVPGRMDERGEALFRGRFGTTPATHAAGEAVILFQVRYWDRWAPRADASELSFFTFTADQPAAFWSGCVFQKEDTANAQLGVLQRTDPTAPWDADPEHDKRLTLFWSGDDRGAPHPIGKQSDQIAWRAFVKYSPGAFDFRTGLSTGWRQTPRLKLFATTYYAPSLTLRSVER